MLTTTRNRGNVYLPGFGAAQGQVQPFNLRPAQETVLIIEQIMVGQPVGQLAEILLAFALTATDPQHLGAMPFFRRFRVPGFRYWCCGQAVHQRQ